VIGITMPGGDPRLLEQLAARLEAIAEGTADLGANTHKVTASIRSDAAWTGDAANAYTAFTGNLAQGVAAAPAPLSKIALAVRDYAGCLQTAQEKVAAYTSAAEVAAVSGNDSGYVNAAEAAAQNANAAVAAWQAAGDSAAAAVNAAGAQLQLGDLFGSQGPVTSWLGRQPVPSDTLAGFPGLGDPVGPQVLKTPGWALGPQIMKTLGAEPGPEILITPPGELGPEILLTPPAELGPEILKTPPANLRPLINYDSPTLEPGQPKTWPSAGHGDQLPQGGEFPYEPPAGSNGQPLNLGRGQGFRDASGNLWQWARPNVQHGGLHWDVQLKGGGYVNVSPNGKIL
jgi:uncharacterized protein YukE